MALIPFETMLECLQSPHSLPGGILSRLERLHYGDVCYMLMHCTLLMQHIPYHYFNNMVQDDGFQLVKADLKDTSNTTDILLVFISNNQLTCIKHIYIRLMVCHTNGQLYKPKSIPKFIQYIQADLWYTKER